MRTEISLLSESERERIHQDSLKILGEVGILFRSARARTILKKQGAAVDEDARIVRIPGELVEEALRTAPREFTLGARHPAFDVALPAPVTGYTLDGAATFALDARTGGRRNAVTADLAASLRIFEELELGTVVWPNVVLSDRPGDAGNIAAGLLSFLYSSKHIQHEVHAPEHVPYVIEGLTAILGSEDAVRARKIFSVCYCTIPPLTHDNVMCDACLDLTEFEVPILPYPMPASGSTGPASLYSNLAVANAEFLSALVLFQLARPGTPVLYGAATGITDFRTGGFLEGTPESSLLNGALGAMAKFYQLPSTVAGCLSDAQSAGPQAVMEKLLTTLPLVLVGADVINGLGEVGTSQILVPEQIVVDHELARFCQRIRDGIEVSDAKDYLADVARVGPGGHFLLEDSTVEACHSAEFVAPNLSVRDTYDAWVQLGRPDVYRRARETVDRILAQPLKNPLPDEVVGKLEDIMRRAGEELA